MCSGHPLDWACDECFARQNEPDFEFCDRCEEAKQYICPCCERLLELPLDNEDICEPCKEEMGGDS